MREQKNRNSKKPTLPDYPKSSIRHPDSRMGFSLIELIMVLTIVGILALVTIPRFGSFYFLKISGAIKKVISDIRYLQQLAVSEHTDTKLVFNTAADTYSAQKFDQGAGSWVNITDPFTRGNLSLNFNSDPQYSGIDISATNLLSSTLRFSWQGIPQEGADAGPANLTAEGSVTFSYKNNSLTIYITPNTGRVRAQ